MFFIIVHCVLYFRYDYDGIFEATPGCRRAVRTAIEAAEKNGIKVIPFRPFGLREAFKLNSSYRGVSINNVCQKVFFQINDAVPSFLTKPPRQIFGKEVRHSSEHIACVAPLTCSIPQNPGKTTVLQVLPGSIIYVSPLGFRDQV